MKTVLISIQPKWCELIASGKKTVEVRKSRPSPDEPFKCYIYCTKKFYRKGDGYFQGKYCGKVIGEFICNGIDRMVHSGTCNNDIRLRIVDKHLNCKEIDYAYLDACKLSYSDIDRYSGGRDVYGWHISELVIYDEPKELSEFYSVCKMNCEYCEMLGYTRVNADEFDMDCKSDWHLHKTLKRPPQSWCYVEELGKED